MATDYLKNLTEQPVWSDSVQTFFLGVAMEQPGRIHDDQDVCHNLSWLIEKCLMLDIFAE